MSTTPQSNNASYQSAMFWELCFGAIAYIKLNAMRGWDCLYSAHHKVILWMYKYTGFKELCPCRLQYSNLIVDVKVHSKYTNIWDLRNCVLVDHNGSVCFAWISSQGVMNYNNVREALMLLDICYSFHRGCSLVFNRPAFEINWGCTIVRMRVSGALHGGGLIYIGSHWKSVD